MDNSYHDVTFTDALGAVQLTVFALLSFGLLAALILMIWQTPQRPRISKSLAIFGIAVFFYAGTIEHLGLARHHMSNMVSGGSDPAYLERGYAEFYLKLWAFRSLSVAILTISAIGLATSRPENGANKRRQATASPSPAP